MAASSWTSLTRRTNNEDVFIIREFTENLDELIANDFQSFFSKGNVGKLSNGEFVFNFPTLRLILDKEVFRQKHCAWN
jgi:hypothetical protein